MNMSGNSTRNLADAETKNLSFFDQGWLTSFGLSHVNVMDYFYCSPFYESTSCNQVLRGQQSSLDYLKEMVGVQYILVRTASEPSLFIIHKLNRSGPENADLIDIYYCLEGVIYQSPNLFEVFRIRTRKAANSIKKSFNTILDTVRY